MELDIELLRNKKLTSLVYSNLVYFVPVERCGQAGQGPGGERRQRVVGEVQVAEAREGRVQGDAQLVQGKS